MGTNKRPYEVECPLDSNPLSNCSWEIFSPCVIDPRTVIHPPGISYSNRGRTLKIKELNPDYLNVCYICIATNELGSNSSLVSNIPFTSKNSLYKYLTE